MIRFPETPVANPTKGGIPVKIVSGLVIACLALSLVPASRFSRVVRGTSDGGPAQDRGNRPPMLFPKPFVTFGVLYYDPIESFETVEPVFIL
jgi:hypothetical protein